MDSSGRKRRTTRQRLFEAAVTLIAEQGFSATTVDEIAERAGVAKGTVYYNFSSKSELFEALLQHGGELLTTSLRSAAEEAVERDGSRLAALDAMVGAGVTFVARHPALTRLYVAELWRTSRAWRETLTRSRQQAVAVLESVLKEAVAAGDLPADIDAPLTASVMFGTILVTALDWAAYQPERAAEEVRATLCQLVRGRLLTGR